MIAGLSKSDLKGHCAEQDMRSGDNPILDAKYWAENYMCSD